MSKCSCMVWQFRILTKCLFLKKVLIWKLWIAQILIKRMFLKDIISEIIKTTQKLRINRALERMGVKTSQLALARCVMRGILGRERSRGRTVEKRRVKTKFCSTYKVYCYGWTVRHFSLPFGSGHLYTICKLSVLNNRIIVSQIEVNICEIN